MWLVYSLPDNNKMYEKAIAWQCKYSIKFVSPTSGEIVEYPVYDINSTQYGSGETSDEFIEYADDFDLWDRFDFTKVDYLRQKIAALNRLLEQGVLTLREYTELLRETQLDMKKEPS